MKFPLFVLIALFAGMWIGPFWLVDQEVSLDLKSFEEASVQDDGGISKASHVQIATEFMDPAIESLSLDQKIALLDELKLAPSMANSIQTLELIASMSESELEAVLKQMGQQGMGSLGDWMMPYYVFTAWVEKNPEGAHRFFEEDANAMQQEMYGSSLFSAWAASDPDSAIAAAELVSG